MTGRRIDSHLHVWDLSASRYAWLTPDHGALYRTFGPEEAAGQLRDAGVDGAVLVQAEDSLQDTEYLLGIAEREEWALGVVGWVQLDDPTRAADQLDRWQRSPSFVGVRHLVHDDPRADFLELPEVRASLAELAARRLPFDVPDAWPAHLPQVERLVRDLPELTVVVDHLAKPPRGRADFADWRASIESVAAAPNSVAKVSGLYSGEAPHTVEALREVWRIALDSFGPERLMWGSDWPIAELHGGYGAVADVLGELVDELGEAGRAALLGGTAERVYGLS
jgi:L-fuconolactonase